MRQSAGRCGTSTELSGISVIITNKKGIYLPLTLLSQWKEPISSPMASLAICPSPSSVSFRNRISAIPARIQTRNAERRNGSGFSIRASASGIVLVEKTEVEKVNRLKAVYLEKVVPLLKDEFSYKNMHEVPKIEKIVVNCGMGEIAQNNKGLEEAMKDLSLITGQRPVKTRARQSIATFKLREGQTVGVAVTLRGNMMYSFLDRLVNLGLPRTRDFQGVNPNSFDGHGNYSIGMREQSVFPEIRYDALGKPRGMDVCITTTAKTDNEAQRLLALMGMPFREGGGPTVVIRKKKKKAHHYDSKSKGRR
ncbi:large ribosomal subunit protein uL5c [Magnolia sinica]|uniref:large ribosomal subunit protein uL5c n=1 Tax=Magnolia sinica TaxID=86752 RepID=UPI002657BD83|nr:large ribosomal subunit protein uL5c [Magnolia sinica]